MPSLIILNGTHRGSTLPLRADVPVLTMGRHAANDIHLDDDRASRMHAQVTYRGGRWHLEDCGSLNGTFVNSQPIQQAILQAGDLIRIGDRLLLYLDDSVSNEGTEIQTAVFRATTAVGSGSGQPSDGRAALVEESVSESLSRIVRDSTILGRLANLLHPHSDSETLLRATIDALVGGIDADAVAVWLVGPDGRLRLARDSGDRHVEHLLASLAVEKSKAIFMENPSGETSAMDTHVLVGSAVGVPIPGPKSCRGAIECHRRATRDPFLQSDLDFAVVVAHQAGLALENLEHRERLELANAELRRRVSMQQRLVGSNSAMRAVLDQIARVGPTQSTVLILGESGTGKELAAHSIHEFSNNAAGPYVTVNCAAFSESLLESELFGPEVGAFTGADRRTIGQFERANRGTIFLDEVGEMSLACQAKVLRVLEGHPFQRLGGDELIQVDVRVVAATHRDLPKRIEEGRFREDLYYRLRVIDIQMPPLRDRGEDVIELASLFLERFRAQIGRGPDRFSEEAMGVMRSYPWPGNVRELRNAVERAVVLGQSDEVTVVDLGLPTDAESRGPGPQMQTLKEVERQHVLWVLKQCGGNKTQACRVLQIGRATLYSKLNE